MKTIYCMVVLLWAISFTSCSESKSPIALQKEILSETGKLEQSIQNLQDSVAKSQSPKNISKQFNAARLQYKKVEWALEYFMPQILNPTQEMNDETIGSQEMHFRPRSFTQLDSIVATGKIVENKALLLQEINAMLDNSKSITSYLETIDLGNEAISSNE